MASQKRLLVGLQIFDSRMTEDEYDIWYVDAKHDEIFACGPKPEELTGDEITVLNCNGWTWDDMNLCWHLYT